MHHSSRAVQIRSQQQRPSFACPAASIGVPVINVGGPSVGGPVLSRRSAFTMFYLGRLARFLKR